MFFSLSTFIHCLGAPNYLLRHCTTIQSDYPDNEPVSGSAQHHHSEPLLSPITNELRSVIMEQVDDFSNQALRVIAMGYLALSELPSIKTSPSGRVFVLLCYRTLFTLANSIVADPFLFGSALLVLFYLGAEEAFGPFPFPCHESIIVFQLLGRRRTKQWLQNAREMNHPRCFFIFNLYPAQLVCHTAPFEFCTIFHSPLQKLTIPFAQFQCQNRCSVWYLWIRKWMS